jgi:cytochrome d ubiquinol oxidase subunit II
VGWRLWRGLRVHNEREPFALGIALFLLSFAGLAVSLWPYAVPRRYTLWEAASPPASLGFVLTGVLILLPLVLGYSMHTYRVFRGKTSAGHGYH